MCKPHLTFYRGEWRVIPQPGWTPWSVRPDLAWAAKEWAAERNKALRY